MKTFKAVPTNIITGFLGVGKTTAILHLLKTKPADERWAVLVNEFGEVGIDGALLSAQAGSIAVKEVPGGCMCCSVGIPSRVAMNQLIKEQNPDRILIEPTGLAHPQQVLDQFSDEYYQSVLSIRASIVLLDPWCLTDKQFSDLPAFQDQIQFADVLVATKADVAEKSQLDYFFQFAGTLRPEKTKIAAVSHGELPCQWLDLPKIEPLIGSASHTHHHHEHVQKSESQETVSTEIQRKENATEFANSCGWVFPVRYMFNDENLLAMIIGLEVPRVKGIFNTDKGRRVINKMRKTVSHKSLESEIQKNHQDSRVEMISVDSVLWPEIESQLMSCLVDR